MILGWPLQAFPGEPQVSLVVHASLTQSDNRDLWGEDHNGVQQECDELGQFRRKGELWLPEESREQKETTAQPYDEASAMAPSMHDLPRIDFDVSDGSVSNGSMFSRRDKNKTKALRMSVGTGLPLTVTRPLVIVT